MKKFIFLLFFGLIAIFANAQLATINIASGNTTAIVNTSYTLTNTTAGYMVYNAPQVWTTTQDFTVTLHKVSGTPTRVNIVLYGQKTPDTPWVSIATGFWKVTSADTVMTLSNTTANRYVNYKALFTPAGTGVSTITKQYFKLYFQ